MKQVFRPKAAFPQAVGRRRSARAKGRRTTPEVEDCVALSPGIPSPHHPHPDRATIISFCRPPEESQHQPKLVPEIRECARREMVGRCPGCMWMGGDWGCDSSRLAQGCRGLGGGKSVPTYAPEGTTLAGSKGNCFVRAGLKSNKQIFNCVCPAPQLHPGP